MSSEQPKQNSESFTNSVEALGEIVFEVEYLPLELLAGFLEDVFGGK